MQGTALNNVTEAFFSHFAIIGNYDFCAPRGVFDL